MPDLVRLVVTGRVQGVGYREFVRTRAEALGMTGWVRNRRDGTLEVVVRGSDERLEDFIADCRRGPPAARVSEVQTEPLAAAEADLPVQGFEVRPTA